MKIAGVARSLLVMIVLVAMAGAETQSLRQGREITARGPLNLRVTFPVGAAGHCEPLLSVGQPGAGDVVFVHYWEGNRLSLGWEQVGGQGVAYAEPVTLTGTGPHEVTILLGSLMPPDGDAFYANKRDLLLLRDMVVVQLDGRAQLVTRAQFPSRKAGRIVLGANRVGGAVAESYFQGSIDSAASGSSGGEGIDLAKLLSWTSTVAWDKTEPSYPGAIRMQLRLPRNRGGQSEPLVATGVNGAGDLLFIRYESDRQIRFGFDHWMVGGPVSDRINIEPDSVQEVIVNFGSLWPPAEGMEDKLAALRKRCLVLLNGKAVFDHTTPFYPSTAKQISYGLNAIGASTAGLFFSGQIFRVESVKPAEIISVIRR